MILLFCSYQKLDAPSHTVKVVIAGEPSSGKRTLLYAFAKGSFVENSPSLDVNTVDIDDIDVLGQTMNLSLWNTSGKLFLLFLISTV